jgi:hypothetical protein
LYGNNQAGSVAPYNTPSPYSTDPELFRAWLQGFRPNDIESKTEMFE